MPKHLLQVIVLLLLPCLVVEPSLFAATRVDDISIAIFRDHKHNLSHSQIWQEALSSVAVGGWRHNILKIGVPFVALWHGMRDPFPTEQRHIEFQRHNPYYYETDTLHQQAESYHGLTEFFGKVHQEWIDALALHDLQPAWPDMRTELQSIDAAAGPLRDVLKRQWQLLKEIDQLWYAATLSRVGRYRVPTQTPRFLTLLDILRGRLFLIWSGLPGKIMKWERIQRPLQKQFESYRTQLYELLFRATRDQLVAIAHQASELGLTENLGRVDWKTASRQMVLLHEIGRQLAILESILADFGPRKGKFAIDWFRRDREIAWWYAQAVRAIKTSEQVWAQHPKGLWDRGAVQLETEERLRALLEHPLYPLAGGLMEAVARAFYGEQADAILNSGGRVPQYKEQEASRLKMPEGLSWQILMKVLNDPVFAAQSTLLLSQPRQRLQLEQLFALNYEPAKDIFSIQEADLVRRLDAIWGPEITSRFMDAWRAEYPSFVGGQTSLPLRAA